MAKNTLYNKIWDSHRVTTLPTGQDQLFIGLHYVHEVTSPQAFAILRENRTPVLFPDRTFSTMDHIIPTDDITRPFKDSNSEQMASALETNVREFGIQFFGMESEHQGIVHVIGPELGLTQPGMTIVCGDSHTSSHGAFGSLAFGIGTSEVRNVLETQTLALQALKVRRIEVTGKLGPMVTAKDVILAIIRKLGVKGGIGYAYEFGGAVIEAMSMEERITVCNMSIEGGARIGYINPDATTYSYLKGRKYAPAGQQWDNAVRYWESIRSDAQAEYDEVVTLDGNQIQPMITWGITPGQSVDVTETLPIPETLSAEEKPLAEQAYAYMKWTPGMAATAIPVHTAFIGSCTNGRIEDLRAAAAILAKHPVHSKVRAIIVPGSKAVKRQAEAEGLHTIFQTAGAEWREPGCSMCLGMNPDKLAGDEVCAATSNRNFMGRMGSPTGRTLLMSPVMAAWAAVKGHAADVREVLS